MSPVSPDTMEKQLILVRRQGRLGSEERKASIRVTPLQCKKSMLKNGSTETVHVLGAGRCFYLFRRTGSGSGCPPLFRSARCFLFRWSSLNFRPSRRRKIFRQIVTTHADEILIVKS
jgi:hypothetical protein